MFFNNDDGMREVLMGNGFQNALQTFDRFFLAVIAASEEYQARLRASRVL